MAYTENPKRAYHKPADKEGFYIDSIAGINGCDYFDAYHYAADTHDYLVVRFGDVQANRALFEIDRRRFFGQASTEVLRDFMRDAFYHLHGEKAFDGFVDDDKSVLLFQRFSNNWQKANEIFKQFLAERSNQ